MRKFRFLMCGLLGSVMLAPAASASIAFQNVQVYRWGYVDHQGTRTADLSYWGGATYDDTVAGTTPDTYHLQQTGTGTISTMSLRGVQYSEASSQDPIYRDEGMNSVSTRFTLNEKLWLSLSGKIQAGFVNEGYNADRMVGTHWTRARIVDAVTGATVFSRIARVDVTDYGSDSSWDSRSLSNNVLLLYPGRYNMIVDSFYELKGSPRDEKTADPQAYAGWNPAVYANDPVWNVGLELYRPPGYVVPEPAAGVTTLVLAAAFARGRRRNA